MADYFPGSCYYTLTLVMSGSTAYDCAYSGATTDTLFPCSTSMSRKYCIDRGPEVNYTITKNCSPSANRQAPTGSIKRTYLSANLVAQYSTGGVFGVIPAGYYIKISCLQAGPYTGCYYYDPYLYWDPYIYPDGGWVSGYSGTLPTYTANGFKYVSAKLTHSITGTVTALNAYLTVGERGFINNLGLGSSVVYANDSNDANHFNLYLYNSIVQDLLLGTSRDLGATPSPCLAC